MKKKISVLLFFSLSLFLTGCSVDYNLYVDENSITESIDAYLPDDAENREYVDFLKKTKQSAYFEMNNNMTYYYRVNHENMDDKIKLNFEYQYRDPVKLQNSNAINRCYYNKSVVKAGDFLTLSTSDVVTCIYKDGEKQVDQINVNIITDLKVEEHNADSKSGNRYTWKITDQNYQHKPIYIKININTEKQKASLNKKEKEQFLLLLAIVVVITSVVVIRILMISKRNNRFK